MRNGALENVGAINRAAATNQNRLTANRTNTMKIITTGIRRIALLCLAVAGIGQSAQAQSVTAKIEAPVTGYTG